MATNTSALTGASRSQDLSALFASRNRVFGQSIWTGILELFRHHPDPVYFGDGAPDRDLMPVDRLREASVKAWAEAPGCLGYGEQPGYAPLRELIAARMAPLGVDVDPNTVLITSGSSQAIDLACRVFLNPGDVVLLEDPTFLGATELFRAHDARLVPVATDGYGMRMDSLEDALIAQPAAKVIYTIPTFQNPTGTTMPLERREHLLALAREHKVAVLEDDPYVELRYSGEPVPPLRALDPSVVYLGTFSKTIAPGIRTGWTVAPPEVHRLLLANREVSDISNDRITMRTVYYTAVDFLTDHVAGTLDTYRSRRDAMLGALAESMPEGVTWSRPDGGFFVWIMLPAGLDAIALVQRAADNGVIYFPGQWFFPNEDQANALRLSFSTVPPDRIVEGVRRLALTLREALDS